MSALSFPPPSRLNKKMAKLANTTDDNPELHPGVILRERRVVSDKARPTISGPIQPQYPSSFSRPLPPMPREESMNSLSGRVAERFPLSPEDDEYQLRFYSSAPGSYLPTADNAAAHSSAPSERSVTSIYSQQKETDFLGHTALDAGARAHPQDHLTTSESMTSSRGFALQQNNDPEELYNFQQVGQPSSGGHSATHSTPSGFVNYPFTEFKTTNQTVAAATGVAFSGHSRTPQFEQQPISQFHYSASTDRSTSSGGKIPITGQNSGERYTAGLTTQSLASSTSRYRSTSSLFGSQRNFEGQTQDNYSPYPIPRVPSVPSSIAATNAAERLRGGYQAGRTPPFTSSAHTTAWGSESAGSRQTSEGKAAAKFTPSLTQNNFDEGMEHPHPAALNNKKKQNRNFTVPPSTTISTSVESIEAARPEEIDQVFEDTETTTNTLDNSATERAMTKNSSKRGGNKLHRKVKRSQLNLKDIANAGLLPIVNDDNDDGDGEEVGVSHPLDLSAASQSTAPQPPPFQGGSTEHSHATTAGAATSSTATRAFPEWGPLNINKSPSSSGVAYSPPFTKNNNNPTQPAKTAKGKRKQRNNLNNIIDRFTKDLYQEQGKSSARAANQAIHDRSIARRAKKDTSKHAAAQAASTDTDLSQLVPRPLFSGRAKPVAVTSSGDTVYQESYRIPAVPGQPLDHSTYPAQPLVSSSYGHRVQVVPQGACSEGVKSLLHRPIDDIQRWNTVGFLSKSELEAIEAIVSTKEFSQPCKGEHHFCSECINEEYAILQQQILPTNMHPDERTKRIANNKALRNIKNEVETLLENGAISEDTYNRIMADLPGENSLNAGRSDPTRPESSPNTVAPPPARAPAEMVEIARVTAMYRYIGDVGDCQLEAGDQIIVYEFTNGDWWKGKNLRSGQVGIFPRNYVSTPTTQSSAAPQVTYGAGNQAYAGTYPGQSQQAPPPGNPYNSDVPPMQVAEQPSKGSGMAKKFGSKLGNAAIFGAGATIGGNIVNGIL